MARRNRRLDVLSLLSLDGGGPGSISQLRILQEYVTRLAHDKDVDVDTVLLADLFDVIGGVGFGGYIALLLGPLRMPISQAIEELTTLGITLFPDNQGDPNPVANSRRLKEAVEEMLQRQQFPIDIKLKDSRLPASQCKTVVLATSSVNATQCQPFRTYSAREGYMDCTFVEAACATLSIPSIFAPVSIGPRRREQKFTSASFGFNNPTKELIKEAEKIFGSDARVSTILSIGSGRPALISLDGPAFSSNEVLKSIVEDCERVARELATQLFNVDAYLRLNVDRGMEDKAMDDWDELGVIEGHAGAYLQVPAVTNAVDSCLQRLQQRVGSITLGQLNRSTGIKLQAKSVPAVSPYYVVRNEYWNLMKQHLIRAREVKRKIFILSGMGGCGKTQMMAYFVQQYRSQYQHIWFVDANSPSSIKSDLQAAIRSLGEGHEQMTFEDALEFLAKGSHDGKWLLIFDNADNPKVKLPPYFPPCNHGTIIITTRNYELGRLNTTVHLQLGPLIPSEAYETLIRAAHRLGPLLPEEDVSAKQLIEELGYLAVALVQAGSYCYSLSSSSGSYTFGQYLMLFKEHHSKLMSKGDETALDGYERGAYATFDVSYSSLPQPARELLHLSAFFHHADISLSMLECAVQNGFSGYHEHLPRPEEHDILEERLETLLCSDGEWDELYIHGIIRSLQSFSLVSSTLASGSIFLRFHPLVHSWSRYKLSLIDAAAYRQMAIQVIVSCTSPDNRSLYRFLIPHISKLMEGDSKGQLHINDQMGFGSIFLELGYYSKAEMLFRRALVEGEDKIGDNHRHTVAVFLWLGRVYVQDGNWKLAEEQTSKALEKSWRLYGKNDELSVELSSLLAETYHLQGKFTEAEDIQKEVLKQQLTLSEEDNPELVEAAAELANTYHSQGKWTEAETTQKRVLEHQRRVLGNDNTHTTAAAANLATTYHLHGKWTKAEVMQKEVLKKRQRLSGKDSHDTIIAAASLAITYHSQGKWTKAGQMQKEVLEQLHRLFGKDNPDTVKAAADLAITYRSQGKLNEAEEIQKELLERRRRLFGKDNPDTIEAAADLANTYYLQERWAEAETMQEEVIEQRLRLFGKDNPDTIAAAANLAITYHSQGKWTEAEKMQKEVLEQQLRLFGDDNPNTIEATAALADTYYSQERWTEAEIMQKQILERRRRLFGKDNPDTIEAAAALANTYYSQERWTEAEMMQKKVLERRQNLFGNDHLDTISAAADLADTYHSQGKWTKAEEMQKEVMEQRLRLFGKDNPDTIGAAITLAITYRMQGRLVEAEKIQVEVLERQRRLLGIDHPETIMSIANLEQTYYQQGRLSEAKKLMTEAAELSGKVREKQHPSAIQYRAQLSEIRDARNSNGVRVLDGQLIPSPSAVKNRRRSNP